MSELNYWNPGYWEPAYWSPLFDVVVGPPAAITTWQTLAVNQAPSNGTNYPFTAPSVDVRYLLGDLWLSFADTACATASPLRIACLWQFGHAGTHRRDMLIVDANNTTVFDTRTAIRYTVNNWGDHLVTLSWLGASCTLRCTARTRGTPWEPSLIWADTLSPVNGQLDPRTWQRTPRRLQSLRLGLSSLNGDIVLSEGYNMRLQVEMVPAVDGGRRLTRIHMRALPGDGLGRLPGCNNADPVIRRINTVAPTDGGDFTLDAAGCYWLRRPGETETVAGHRYLALGGSAFIALLTATLHDMPSAFVAGTDSAEKLITINSILSDPNIASSGLQLLNDCGPCCTCDDFLKTYEGIRKLFYKYQSMGQEAEQIRDQLQANIDRWEAQRQCRMAQNLQLTLNAEENGTLFIGASHCNNTTCCAAGLTLRATIQYYRNGVPYAVATPAEQTNESYRSDTDGETRTRPIINWPTIDIPFDQASPQTTSTFRTRLQFDPQHEGDAVEVTLSSHSAGIVDPLSGKVCDLPAASSVTLPTAVTTAWVTNPPPAPVRSAITKTIAFGPTDSCRGSGRTA